MICKICGKDNVGAHKCTYCGHALYVETESVAADADNDKTVDESTIKDNSSAEDRIGTFMSYADSSEYNRENEYAIASALIGIIGAVFLIIYRIIPLGGVWSVFSLFFCEICCGLSATFGICGLVQCKKQRKGIGLAVFGIAISALLLILLIVVSLIKETPWIDFIV